MHRYRPALLTLLAALAAPVATRAQEYVLPTPEEYAERAERAENAPLFASHDAIRMTLSTDIKWLRDTRSDSTEVDATLTFVDVDGSETVSTVQVRARGNFRRSKDNCNFPPLRLNFKTGDMGGTVFEGQDKLKLVTPCNDGRDDHQRYIYKEFLTYRLLNTLTPASLRVRLVEITYEDVNGEYDTRTKHGFLIEDNVAMAERNSATLEEVNQFHPARTFGEYSVLASMFNYMIGNTDWSPVYFHNVELIRTEDARYLTVPYDFDFSGAVNARYATVDPSLQDRIRRVTQRLFRGFCRDELTYPHAVQTFADNREAFRQLYFDFAARGYEQFTEKDAEDAWKYFDDFYKMVDDEKRFEREILRDCRDMASGR
jgi:hypothetical protein